MSQPLSFTTQPFPANQNSNAKYSCVLKDENGAAIPAASMNTLTLTLTDQATGAVINGRTNQSVLNVNGGTLDSSGNFAMTFGFADNPIVTAGSVALGAIERHVALFKYTYNSSAGKEEHQVVIAVLRLE